MERSGRLARAVGFANLLNVVLFQGLSLTPAMPRPGYSPVSQPASDLGIGMPRSCRHPLLLQGVSSRAVAPGPGGSLSVLLPRFCSDQTKHL